MKAWQRYLVFQLPGLGLLAILLTAATYWFSLPIWASAVGGLLWIAKDAALYPLLKRAYEDSKSTGTASLVGCLGTAQEDLSPKGLVRIGPELWRAVSVAPVGAGQQVRVTGSDGMTLRVEAVPDSGAGRDQAPGA